MDFGFSEDQRLLRESVRGFLRAEVTPERVRALWESDSGRSPARWAQLAELGATGVLVPEECGGLGLSAVDFVLLAEECGAVALPEPLVDTAMVAVPLLADSSVAAECLPAIVAGEAMAAVGHPIDPAVADAHVARWILLQRDEAVHVLPAEAVRRQAMKSLDPSRRMFSVDWSPRDAIAVVASAPSALLNAGALGAAAQLLGAAARMLEMTVDYTASREQFGVPVGSFQAVKHRLADVAIALEFARPVVYRAAWDVAHAGERADSSVSHAKLAAGRAATLAARHCLQAHGAIGYTWEADLHIWMKRAWTLDQAWGDAGFHRRRLAEHALSDDAPIGPGGTWE